MLISPIKAPKEILGRLPPVYVCVGGVDLVRDEGIVFAEKVREAGGKVRLKVYHGAAHAYTIQDEVSLWERGTRREETQWEGKWAER